MKKKDFKLITEEQWALIKEDARKKDFKVRFIVEKERIVRADNYKSAREWMGCDLINHHEGEKHNVLVYVENIKTGEKYIHKNLKWEKIKKKQIGKKEELNLDDLKKGIEVRCEIGTENWETMDNAYNYLGKEGKIMRDISERKIPPIEDSEFIKKVAEKWDIQPIILTQIFCKEKKRLNENKSNN